MARLQRLTALRMRHTFDTAQFISTLAGVVPKLARLQVLDVAFNNVVPSSAFVPLAQAATKLPALVELSVARINLFPHQRKDTRLLNKRYIMHVAHMLAQTARTRCLNYELAPLPLPPPRPRPRPLPLPRPRPRPPLCSRP